MVFSTSTALTPLGFNASLSSDVIITFQCTTEGTSHEWFINHLPPGVLGVGFSPSPAAQSGDSFAGNLSVPAREENDNMRIQ